VRTENPPHDKRFNPMNPAAEMRMARVYLRYYSDLAKYSLFFSVLGGGFGASLNRPFLQFFLLTHISVGSIGAIYFYHNYQNSEYYFYHNLGLSKTRLNIVANAANLILCLALFFTFKSLKWL
jgi:hypothetical protein